jgi:hypothetical protein
MYLLNRICLLGPSWMLTITLTFNHVQQVVAAPLEVRVPENLVRAQPLAHLPEVVHVQLANETAEVVVLEVPG